MFEVLLSTLGAGLQLWAHKDKMKYITEMGTLEEAWYEEFNKDPFSDAVLDNIDLKLRNLSKRFAAQVRVTKA